MTEVDVVRVQKKKVGTHSVLYVEESLKELKDGKVETELEKRR